MARCCATTVSDLPRSQETWWGVLAPYANPTIGSRAETPIT